MGKKVSVTGDGFSDIEALQIDDISLSIVSSSSKLKINHVLIQFMMILRRVKNL
jgi:hypothetical protein